MRVTVVLICIASAVWANFRRGLSGTVGSERNPRRTVDGPKRKLHFCRPTDGPKSTTEGTKQDQIDIYAKWMPIAYDILFKPFWEKVAKHLVPTDKEIVLFDGGMNVGKWAKGMLMTWKKVEYHGFEPFAATMKYAQGNITRHARKLDIDESKLHFNNVALSNVTGSQTLYQGESPGVAGSEHFSLGKSRGRPKGSYKAGSSYSQNMGVAVTTTKTMTLDDYVMEHSIDHIDILKLDTEGAEPLVLRGADYTLTKIRPPIVFFECHEFWQASYDVGYSVKYMTELLARYGYDFFYIVVGKGSPNVLLYPGGPFYDPIYETRLGWRNCFGISQEAPNRDRFLTSTEGGENVPAALEGVLPFLMKRERDGNDRCKHETPEMLGDPSEHPDLLAVLPEKGMKRKPRHTDVLAAVMPKPDAGASGRQGKGGSRAKGGKGGGRSKGEWQT